MRYNYTLFCLLLTLLGCQKEDASLQTSPCQSPYGTLKRRSFIQDVPATIVMTGQNKGESSFQIVPTLNREVDEANQTPWGSCNLETAFQKDSLKVRVSGYFLTSDRLELMNVSPLPFEVTSMQLRE
jgi:hypothetical protein